MPRIPKKNSDSRPRKATTAAKVPSDAKVTKMPPMPVVAGRTWHAHTVEWWREVWASPFAPE